MTRTHAGVLFGPRRDVRDAEGCYVATPEDGGGAGVVVLGYAQQFKDGSVAVWTEPGERAVILGADLKPLDPDATSAKGREAWEIAGRFFAGRMT